MHQHDGAAALDPRAGRSRPDAGARRLQAFELALRRDRRAPHRRRSIRCERSAHDDGHTARMTRRIRMQHMAFTPTGRVRLRRGGGRAHASRPSTSAFSGEPVGLILDRRSSCGMRWPASALRKATCRAALVERLAGFRICAQSHHRAVMARLALQRFADVEHRARSVILHARKSALARWFQRLRPVRVRGLMTRSSSSIASVEIAACRAWLSWARVISRSAVSEPERDQRRWIRSAARCPCASSSSSLAAFEALEQPFQRGGRAALRRGTG